MTTKTVEVEISGEDEKLALKLIDRANKLGDEITQLQSTINAGGVSEREARILHDELDVVRDYREITLERIALVTLGDQAPPLRPDHPDYQPTGLGMLGEED